ncbi:GAF domain-containing sensor histidine kinase [Nocardioides sp. Root190]|uniref:GAF domain-containing sensor histidine kinase n=1 Tax=Nocardioides sp. Root190 TaxID=1736488 RepID=UPI00138ED9BF|nr:GAF domain-containing protein [Nocardioides sp. Root190]
MASDPLLATLLDVRSLFDPGSALTLTLRGALDALGQRSSVAWVALAEPDGGLVIEQVLGERTSELPELSVGAGQGLTGNVFERAAVHWVDEYVAASSITHEFDSVIEAERIRRMIAAPLSVDNAVLGVLSVGSRDFGVFGDRVISDVEQLARRASNALAIARAARANATAAALAERRRVSEELHDGVGALLFSLVSRTERLQRRIGETEVGLEVGALQEELAEVSTMVRTLVSGWHQSATDDVCAEVTGIVDDFERRTGFDVLALFLGRVPRLDAARMQAVTRFVGIALSNVERHSKASRVTVTVSGLPGQVAVAVFNDGPAPAYLVPGVGLGGAEERIARLGGSLDHQGDDNVGFTVRARIPV